MPEVIDLSLDHATVLVRHPTAGSKARLFQTPATFHQVYDWAGTFDFYPKHYKILTYDGKYVPPETELTSGSFNMLPVEQPIPISPSGTVSFQGFASSTPSSSISSSRLSEKSDLYIGEIDSDSFFDSLEKIREKEVEKFDNLQIFDVNRETVYSEILELYKKRTTFIRRIRINFIGESGSGDGITKDTLYQILSGRKDVSRLCSNSSDISARVFIMDL